jgi:ABC-type glycerol-3-phosphate transport system permease component
MTSVARGSQLGIRIVKALVVIVFLGPILLALVSAFRPNGEIFKYSGTLNLHTFLPIPGTLGNFATAAHEPQFIRQVLNTVLLAVVQSTLTVVLALLAAFPLARMKFRGRGVIFYLLIATMFIPFEALAVPLFLIVKDLGQLNSFWGLLLPWVAGPVATFVLRQAMADIPRSLDEAVMIDGGGVPRILRHAIIPNVWPAMVTVWLITFIYVWDSFLWPLIIMSDPHRQLAQVGIVNLINPNEIDYGTLFAMSLIAAGPVVVIFLLLQRFYQQGVTASGLK